MKVNMPLKSSYLLKDIDHISGKGCYSGNQIMNVVQWSVFLFVSNAQVEKCLKKNA